MDDNSMEVSSADHNDQYEVISAVTNTNEITPVTTDALESNRCDELTASETLSIEFAKPSIVNARKKDNNDSSKQKKIKAENLNLVEPLANLPYKEPTWGGSCGTVYTLEVIKTGSVVDNIDLSTKSYHVFGRLPNCDIVMEHPSISRYHCILQCCSQPDDRHERGWYLYDLESTHGTWINKNKVKPLVYYRVRVGYVLKFGGSTRLYVLQGPENDMEAESDLSIMELKEQRAKQIKEAEILRNEKEELLEAVNAQTEKESDDGGCSWGMGEDAVETIEENPFALPDLNESANFDDPKKTLKGYFEREGLEIPEYDITSIGRGEHKCRLTLPVESASGEPVVAEGVASKKKEAIVACALEACRILDSYGVLRTATHEPHQVKKRDWEAEDFYDSDEDVYLDRTGLIEVKRKQRMKRLRKEGNNKSETYESLVVQLDKVNQEISEIEHTLANAKAASDALEEDSLDALDAYMSAIKAGAMDTKTKMNLKRRLLELRGEQQRIQKLANIAKPALPKLQINKENVPANAKQKVVPLFGKIKTSSKGSLIIKPIAINEPQSLNSRNESSEEEDEAEITDEKQPVMSQPIKSLQSDEPLEDLSTKKNIDSLSEETINNKLLGPTSPCKKELDSNEASHSKKISIDNADKNPVTRESKTPTAASNRHELKSHQLKTSRVRINADSSKINDNLSKEYCSEDPDYAMWMPPEDQSGDGKTKLNERFGY